MATREEEIKQRQSDIKTLEELAKNDSSLYPLINERKADLEKFLAEAPERKEEKAVTQEGDVFRLDMTEEEYDKAGSKFAEAGAHLSEMGMPYWKTMGKSIGFPFIIVEEGPDKGKENEIFAGVEKGGVWKLKEILGAIGIPVNMVNGKPQFSAMDCAGKQFLSVWTTQVDTRLPEEGGKGGTYTKPTGALPVGAKVEEGVGI